VSAAPLLDAEDSSDNEILHDTMFDSTAPAATAASGSQSGGIQPEGQDTSGIEAEGSGLVVNHHDSPKGDGPGTQAASGDGGLRA
jgi:hypothetical protein